MYTTARSSIFTCNCYECVDVSVVRGPVYISSIMHSTSIMQALLDRFFRRVRTAVALALSRTINISYFNRSNAYISYGIELQFNAAITDLPQPSEVSDTETRV